MMFDISALNWVDIGIFTVIAISVVIGFIRGFVKEVISLVTWVLAIWISISFSTYLSGYLASFIASEPLRLGIIFIVLLIGIVLVGNVISRGLVGIVGKTGLSGVNHLLGVGFGLLRGAMIIIVALLLVELLFSPYDSPSWKNSQILPHAKVATDWLRGAFPQWVQQLDQKQAEVKT